MELKIDIDFFQTFLDVSKLIGKHTKGRFESDELRIFTTVGKHLKKLIAVMEL